MYCDFMLIKNSIVFCIGFYNMEILFPQYLNMLNQNRPKIQLGGQSLFSSHSFLRTNPITHTPSLQFINMNTKESTISPHKISHKISPNKCKIPTQRHSRQKNGQQNGLSSIQMENSTLSLVSKMSGRTLLEQRSNLILPKSKGISLNYSTKISPGHSCNGSFHQQEIMSPSKIVQSSSRTPYELQLERKLKIVQTRISELHREKQQIAVKLNQQNRKVYHQNISLKQKINQLAKALQKVQNIENIASSQRTHGSSAETYALQNSQLQIANLKRQIIQLEECLTQKGSTLSELTAQNQTLSTSLSKATLCCENMQVEIKRLSDLLQKKHNQLQESQTINADLQDKIQKYEQIKLSQITEIEQIKQLSLQNEENQKLILKEYQIKIEEYQNAYNSNQQLIAHLQQQLQNYQNTAQSVIKEQAIEESAVHNELTSQCQELQENLLTAIQQRDTIIENLNAQNSQLVLSLQQRQREIQQILEEDKQKTSKLESASSLLQKFTLKVEQLEQKYKDLTQKYEFERSQLKTEVVAEKCKKCQQLLKIVLRLNTHLNPKRT